jgi:hypothetical protein
MDESAQNLETHHLKGQWKSMVEEATQLSPDILNLHQSLCKGKQSQPYVATGSLVKKEKVRRSKAKRIGSDPV